MWPHYTLAACLSLCLAVALPLHAPAGWGPLFPYKSMQQFNMTWAESMSMFLTGKGV